MKYNFEARFAPKQNPLATHVPLAVDTWGGEILRDSNSVRSKTLMYISIIVMYIAVPI